jgi:hypothetical protein
MKKSTIHQSVGIAMGDTAHYPTDEVMSRGESGIGRVRWGYRYGPLLGHGLLKGAGLSDAMEDLRCKRWHDVPTPETIYEHGRGV